MVAAAVESCFVVYSLRMHSAEELNGSRPSIHNIRCVLMIILLVAAMHHPFVQSLIYLASALLSLAWDLRARPYKSALMSSQQSLLGVGKLAAGAGYVLLNAGSEGVSTGAADWICRLEIAVLLVAVVGGLGLCTTQLAIAAREGRREEKERIRVATGPPSEGSQSAVQQSA